MLTPVRMRIAQFSKIRQQCPPLRRAFYSHTEVNLQHHRRQPVGPCATKLRSRMFIPQMSLCSRPPHDRHQNSTVAPSSSNPTHDLRNGQESQRVPSKDRASVPRMQIIFTCAKCETRAMKSFTKNAYERGVVIITCPGCESRHLIADNLGWFGEHRNIEEILSGKGQGVVKITGGDVDYTPSA